ncbi:MAG TPA: hypothetical protein EYQ00_15235 [Dehalococcoidia bacterium]|nr:hypothetical protein [Dehalococcoidia bacterium]
MGIGRGIGKSLVAHHVGQGILLVVGLVGHDFGVGVDAPLGHQRLDFLSRRAKFEGANFLRNDRTFMSWLQLGHQFRLEAAGLDGIQVAHLEEQVITHD